MDHYSALALFHWVKTYTLAAMFFAFGLYWVVATKYNHNWWHEVTSTTMVLALVGHQWFGRHLSSFLTADFPTRPAWIDVIIFLSLGTVGGFLVGGLAPQASLLLCLVISFVDIFLAMCPSSASLVTVTASVVVAFASTKVLRCASKVAGRRICRTVVGLLVMMYALENGHRPSGSLAWLAAMGFLLLGLFLQTVLSGEYPLIVGYMVSFLRRQGYARISDGDYSTAQKRINAAVNERDLEAPLAGNEANHFDLQSLFKGNNLQPHHFQDDILFFIMQSILPAANFVYQHLGIQRDIVRSQAEHALVLAKAKLSIPDLVGTARDKAEQVVKAVNMDLTKEGSGVHECTKSHYLRLCEHLGLLPLTINNHSPAMDELPDGHADTLELMTLLCIWNEANNFRFAPSVVSWFYHQAIKHFNDGTFPRNANNDDFLNRVVKPLWKQMRQNTETINYDDINAVYEKKEHFEEGCLWTVPAFPIPGVAAVPPLPPQRTALSILRTAKKSFGELGHWFNVVLVLRPSFTFLFTALAVMISVAFASVLEWQQTATLHVASCVLWTQTLMNLLCTMVWTWQSHARSMLITAEIDAAIAVRLVTYTLTFCGQLYEFAVSFSNGLLQDSSHGTREHTTWMNYLALSITVIVIHHLTFFLETIPGISRFLYSPERGPATRFLMRVIKPSLTTMSGHLVWQPLRQRFKSFLFWASLLSVKLIFSYYFEVQPAVRIVYHMWSTHEINHSKPWIPLMERSVGWVMTGLACFVGLLLFVADGQVLYPVWASMFGYGEGYRMGLGQIRSISDLATRFLECIDGYQSKLVAKGSLRTFPQFGLMWNEIISKIHDRHLLSDREVSWLRFGLLDEIGAKEKILLYPAFFINHVINKTRTQVSRHQTYGQAREQMGMEGPVLQSGVYLMEVLLNRLAGHGKDGPNTALQDDLPMEELDQVLGYMGQVVALLHHQVEVCGRLSKSGSYVLSNQLRRISAPTGLAPIDLKPDRLVSILRVKGTVDIIYAAHAILNMSLGQMEPEVPEATRRLYTTTNSWLMEMKKAPLVKDMKTCTILTPYYKEDVICSMDSLMIRNAEGVSVLDFIKRQHPQEWTMFREECKARAVGDPENSQQLRSNDNLKLKVRLWGRTSLRSQTLYRTVHGVSEMFDSLMAQAKQESPDDDPVGVEDSVSLMFNYVVTCQVYSQMRKGRDPKATEIDKLMEMYPRLRIASIDAVEHDKDPRIIARYDSVLYKWDQERRCPTEVYRYEFPGNPIVGEGKPENQNSAITFTRGEYLQVLDMNQDGYFEEGLKWRNALELFNDNSDSSCPPMTILGFTEHIFSGGASAVANFMGEQERSFTSIMMRNLSLLFMRLHYGHPDVFRKTLYMQWGGASKASKSINLSEDIFAGFVTVLSGCRVGFDETVTFGKGRDVGLTTITIFEGKLSGGAAEQFRSRDMPRMCEALDTPRNLTYYYGGVGHYPNSAFTMDALRLMVYIMLVSSLFGLSHKGFDPAPLFNTWQMLLAGIGMLQTLPLIAQWCREFGSVHALIETVKMFASSSPLYFIFQIKTRHHYFSRTILAGGAKYLGTGRGFVTDHVKYTDTYRMFAASHMYFGFEILTALLLEGYFTQVGQYWGRTWSSYLVALSLLFSPFLFNLRTFIWSVVVDDFEGWRTWLWSWPAGKTQSAWDEDFWSDYAFIDGVSVMGRAGWIADSFLPLLVGCGIAYNLAWTNEVIALSLLSICVGIVGFLWLWFIDLRRTGGHGWAWLIHLIGLFVICTSMLLIQPMVVLYLASLYFIMVFVTAMLLALGAMERARLWYKLQDTFIGYIQFVVLFILACLKFPARYQSRCIFYDLARKAYDAESKELTRVVVITDEEAPLVEVNPVRVPLPQMIVDDQDMVVIRELDRDSVRELEAQGHLPLPPPPPPQGLPPTGAGDLLPPPPPPHAVVLEIVGFE